MDCICLMCSGVENVTKAATDTMKIDKYCETENPRQRCFLELISHFHTYHIPQETWANASTERLIDRPLEGVVQAAMLSSSPKNSLEIRGVKSPYLVGAPSNVLLGLVVVSRQ